jgi:hypothetical protein
MSFLFAILALVPPALPYMTTGDGGGSALTISCKVMNPEGDTVFAEKKNMPLARNEEGWPQAVIEGFDGKLVAMKAALYAHDDYATSKKLALTMTVKTSRTAQRLMSVMQAPGFEIILGDPANRDFGELPRFGFRLSCQVD